MCLPALGPEVRNQGLGKAVLPPKALGEDPSCAFQLLVVSGNPWHSLACRRTTAVTRRSHLCLVSSCKDTHHTGFRACSDDRITYAETPFPNKITFTGPGGEGLNIASLRDTVKLTRAVISLEDIPFPKWIARSHLDLL